MLKKLLVSVILVMAIFTTACVNINNNDIQNSTADADFIARQSKYYNVTWVSPSDVQIDNYYAGADADFTLYVHNGKDVVVSMKIDAESPSYTKDGYELAPSSVVDWVYISDKSFVMQPKETREILVSLRVPSNQYIEAEKWEFRVTVFEQGQGNISKGSAIRCFVDMK